VRFTDEVSGTGELAVINRGDHSEISVFPGLTLDNPLSMNTVDVCPVGALVSADFLYRERVWYLNSKNSVCADCAVGCNTRVDSDKKGEIKRVAPRRNDAVNKEWMCDAGRLSFPYVHEYRLAHPLRRNREATWEEALEGALAALRQSQNLLLLVSAWTTNEGLRAALELSRVLPGARLAAFANPRGQDQAFPGFTISGDKNPNRAGAAEILGIKDIEGHLASQAPADIVFTIGNIPRYQPTPELFDLLDRAQAIVALDFYRSAFVEHERTVVALPGLSHFEKTGEFTNRQGLVQSFEAAIAPIGEGRPEADVLKALMAQLVRSGAIAG
jgi:NADH-quinone oxidoreductase subunit G